MTLEQGSAEAMGAETVESTDHSGGDQAAVTQEAQPHVASDWRDGLAPDVRNALDVDSIEDLAKGYVNAQQMIGGSIRIPSKEAGAEDWDKFYDRFKDVQGLTRYNPDDLTSLYEAAGRPADAKGYGLEGVPEDFLKVAHEAGLNRQQVEAIVGHHQAVDHVHNQMNEEATQQGINALRQEWGLAFDRKVEEGRRAVAFLEQTSPGLAEALDSTGAGDNPAVIRLFQTLGANLKEGQGFAGSHEGSSGITPHEARQQIMEMQNNPQHPYHHGDESAMERFLDLHRYAYPE